MLSSTTPPRHDPIHAIWMLIGSFWGLLIGFFGSILFSIFKLKIGGD
jgi:hypothetical protein